MIDKEIKRARSKRDARLRAAYRRHKSYRKAASATGSNVATVWRAVRRGGK